MTRPTPRPIHQQAALPALGVALAALIAAGCAQDLGAGGAQVAIDVLPLSLSGITEARYTLTVVNGQGEEVWTKAVDSTRYGDGAGSVSLVGPCDASASAAENTVELVVDGLSDADGPLTPGVDFVNPAPAGAPLTRTFTCLANQDQPVGFDITIARAAKQGFFDVALELVDVFCSAKFDCQDQDNQTLRLLFDQSGQRNATGVLALACTGGPGADTHLYLSDLNVSCGDGDQLVDPSLGPGKLSAVAGSGLPSAHLFDALVSQGSEQLGNYAKRYWNVALGLDDVTGCTLTATATASDGPLDGGVTPTGTTWPLIQWAVPLDSCTRHPLNAADGVVSIGYASDIAFAHAFNGAALPNFGSASHPAGANCLAIKTARPSAASGVYWIDPAGSSYQAYCDMDTDGGGWTLALNLDTSDGHVMWWGEALWTNDNAYGDVTSPFDGDLKSPAFMDYTGSTELLLAVHEQGTVAGWSAFSRPTTASLSGRLQGGDNTVIGSAVLASATAGITQGETLVSSSTTLYANRCVYGTCVTDTGAGADGQRIGSAASSPSNNIGGGLGNWADMGYCCSGTVAGHACNGSTIRTCSEAQVGWTPDYGTQPAPGGTYGSDSCQPPSNSRADSSCSTANWAAYNGINYDYAVFLR